MDTPKPNDIYRHFKGNTYKVITVAEHTESGEKLVIYQARYGDNKVYARPLEMFMSPVDKDKYPDATQTMRFEKLDPERKITEVMPGAGAQAVKPESSEEAKEQVAPSKPEPTLESILDEFIMVDTYEEKLEIMVMNKNYLTNDSLTNMAIICDIQIPEDGSFDERFESLKKSLIILEKYECNRLR